MASTTPTPPGDLAAYGLVPRTMQSFELKLERALEHLYSAQARTDNFLERDPGSPVLEENGPKGEMAFWYQAFIPPDPEIVPHVTDCIHNLRHALDHLAYALAIHVTGSDPPTNEATTGFPITDQPSQFDGSVGGKIGPTKKIPRDMRTALEAAQPYSGGKAKLLAVLRDLDDLDKHRFPPLVTVGAVVSDLDIAELHAEWVRGPTVGPIEHGTEIMRWAPKPGSHNVDVQFRCTNHVAFGKPSPAEGLEPIALLSAMREYIREDVIPPFAPFLP